jgi:NAD dependent epimerase/dehydratase family enzyme
MPAFVVKLAFGEMGEELLLGSTKTVPNRLQESGYEFAFPELEPAFRHLLGR